MNLFCFGLNHRTAPIEARERFLGHARTEALLRDLGCHEVLLLTTCNRVEIYAAADRSILSEHLAQSLRDRWRIEFKRRFGRILSNGKRGVRPSSLSRRLRARFHGCG